MAYSLGNYGIAPQTTIGNPRFENLVKAELALTAWRHGRVFGGHAASLAIAQCLSNRFKKGWGSWLSIIEGVPKFSATLVQPTGYPEVWNRDFLRILSEIDPLVEGTSRDTINGGLYWANLNEIDNPWFMDAIARNSERQRVADVAGVLVFWM